MRGNMRGNMRGEYEGGVLYEGGIWGGRFSAASRRFAQLLCAVNAEGHCERRGPALFRRSAPVIKM